MTAKTKQPKEVKYPVVEPLEYQESADTVYIVRWYRTVTDAQATGMNIYWLKECNCWRFMGSTSGELKDARRFTRRSHAVNCINRQKQFDRYPTKYEILECKVGMYIGEKTYWNE